MLNGKHLPLDNRAGISDPAALRAREQQHFADALTANRHLPPSSLLSTDWIREFHRSIFGALYLHAGEFRNEPIRLGWHVPALQQAAEIEQTMQQFCRDCGRRLQLAQERSEALPALLGFAFWKLTYIAPFLDGNGRIANGLNVLLQQSFGLSGRPLYDRAESATYARFVTTLRAYDAGNASPFFDFLKERLQF